MEVVESTEVRTIRLGKKANSILVVGVQGHGKTQMIERMKENFKEEHSDGVIVEIPDPKMAFESGFAFFEPDDPVHLFHLKKQGERSQTQDLEIFHPYHPNVPDVLPECVKIYTAPLRTIRREETLFLIGSQEEKRAIDHLFNVIPSLQKNATIWDLLHFMEDDFISMSKRASTPPQSEYFWLRRVKPGDVRDLSLIVRVFSFFRHWAFLHPEGFKYNLNVAKMLNDDKKYHLFSNRYVPDIKLRYFVNFYMFRRIIYEKTQNNRLRKPLLVVIPELRSICPSTSASFFQRQIAEELSRILHICRTHEISIIADAQSLKLTDSSATGSFADRIIGNITEEDAKELSNIADYMQRRTLMKLPVGTFVWLTRKEESFPFKARFPRHDHKQEGEDFIREWEKKKLPMRNIALDKSNIEAAWRGYDEAWKIKAMAEYIREQRKKKKTKKYAKNGETYEI